ncbi:MAG: hypothetical protein DMF64_07120 [Acidobacteria bacterium]|nr:MAG: hypothetical protein DMF64_07120 [Acidobacteriota bacterium]
MKRKSASTRGKDGANTILPVQVETNDLTPQQQSALVALLSCPTYAAASAKSGVSPATLWRYTQDETFARRLREARAVVVSQAVLRLQYAASDAVKALHDIVNSAETSGSVRVAAARVIIEQTFRAVELDDLRARINELEQFILKKQEEDALDRGRKTASNEEDEDD